MHIQAGLGGGYSQDETADEQHDHRVCKTGHYLFIAEELSSSVRIADPLDTGIRGTKQQEDHDGNRSRPSRDQLKDPHQGCIDEYRYDPLLYLGKTVNPEGFSRQEPEDQDYDGDEDEAEALFL